MADPDPAVAPVRSPEVPSDPRSLDDLPRCPKCRSADILRWDVAGWAWRCVACEERFGQPFIYSDAYRHARSPEAPEALMLAAYLAFIRGVDIPETIAAARAVLVERTLRAEDRLAALTHALTALVTQWREEARKDHALRHDDVEDGVWAHQHEASGRSRKATQCADQLAALLADPVVPGDEVDPAAARSQG